MPRGRVHVSLNSGEVFGLLTVVRREGDYHGHPGYLCQCACGKTVVAGASFLRRGLITSCGHSKKGCFRKTEEEALFTRFKATAAGRGLTMLLSFTTFKNLIRQPCAYCGAPPRKTGYARCPTIEVNGIDRRDNTAGYVEDNCVPCCPDCNWAKADKSEAEFLKHVYAVCAHCRHRLEKRTVD